MLSYREDQPDSNYYLEALLFAMMARDDPDHIYTPANLAERFALINLPITEEKAKEILEKYAEVSLKKTNAGYEKVHAKDF